MLVGLFLFVGGGMYVILRSAPHGTDVVRLLFGYGVGWGAACGLAGGVAYGASGFWSHELLLPYLGLIFGLVSGATFGLLSFVRFGAVPRSAFRGSVLGLGSACFFVAMRYLWALILGEFASTLWLGDLAFLPIGTALGGLSVVVLRRPQRRIAT
jgi:hypothetical protein